MNYATQQRYKNLQVEGHSWIVGAIFIISAWFGIGYAIYSTIIQVGS